MSLLQACVLAGSIIVGVAHIFTPDDGVSPEIEQLRCEKQQETQPDKECTHDD